MSFLLDHRYSIISIIIVSLAVWFKQPILFILLGLTLLLALIEDRRRYFLVVVFIFLSFYGSYALFGIEPLFAPLEIKLGKDIIWLILLGFIVPSLNWRKPWRIFPRPTLWLTVLFVLYVLGHSLTVAGTGTEKLLEIRNYLEYLPLLFIPSFLIKNTKMLKEILIDFALIGIFVALITFSQDIIPGISMLGGYRANSTLPNFFHLGIFLNALILIVSSLFVFKFNLKRVHNWVWLGLTLIYLGIMTYSFFLTDSRGLTVALFVSWLGLVIFLLRSWRNGWLIIVPGIISVALFFTVGPDWASSRYHDLIKQVNSPLISLNETQEIKQEESILDVPSGPTEENKKLTELVREEGLSEKQRDYIANHSEDRSLVLRVLNINRSLEYLKQKPVLGNGLMLKNGDPNTAYATDFFVLDLLVHLGVLGAVLFFGLVFTILARGVIIYLRAKDLEQRILLPAFIFIIIQYLISSLTTSSWIAFPVNSLFWLFSGIGLYLTLPDKGEPLERNNPN
jgi:cell division protein FtsW (lipid II flippase)